MAMAFVRGAVVGVVAWFLATIGYVLIATTVFLRRHPQPPGVEVGFDLRWLITSPLYWLVALLAFALGFLLTGPHG